MVRTQHHIGLGKSKIKELKINKTFQKIKVTRFQEKNVAHKGNAGGQKYESKFSYFRRFVSGYKSITLNKDLYTKPRYCIQILL